MNNGDNSNSFMDSETQDMLRQFVSEAFDSLDTNEPIVENLRNDNNSEDVNAIFRVFHTLKGLSGFFEMQVIHKVTHEAETLLDVIRKQNKKQNEETITVIYQTFDFLRDLLQRVSTEFTDQSGAEESEDMILIIRDCLDKVKNPTEAELAFTKESSLDFNFPDIDEPGHEVEEFIPQEIHLTEHTEEVSEIDSLITGDMFDQYLTNAYELIDLSEKNLLELEKAPDNAKLVQETFGAIHSLKGNSGFMGFSEIEEIGMETETILDSIRSKALDVDQNIITILLSNTEVIRTRLDALAKKSESSHSEHKEILPVEKIEKPVQPIEKSPIVETAVKTEPKKDKPKADKPVKKQDDLQSTSQLSAIQKKDIRVETTKIDKLFDMVGELITIETMVTNNPDLKGLNLPNFNKSANMLNKITRELQEISMSIRMMPLEGLFNKMKRLVRDVSLKMNKKVNL